MYVRYATRNVMIEGKNEKNPRAENHIKAPWGEDRLCENAIPLHDHKHDRRNKDNDARRHLIRQHEPECPLAELLITGRKRCDWMRFP